MLSYDAPVSANGQNPSAMPGMSANMNTLGGDPKPLSTTLTPVIPTNATESGQPEHRHIWLVTGPAGCGKSTVAAYVSSTLGLPYVEGDDYHPPSNVKKMGSGIPLTDEDRWDWLIVLREQALLRLAEGAKGVVVTCSALKRKYRDVIRVAQYYSPNVVLHFIYLHAPEAVLLKRVGLRTLKSDHYMKDDMVRSQFSILEPPTAEETDVVSIDVSKTMAEVQQEALEKVSQKMDEAE